MKSVLAVPGISLPWDLRRLRGKPHGCLISDSITARYFNSTGNFILEVKYFIHNLKIAGMLVFYSGKHAIVLCHIGIQQILPPVYLM